MSDFTPLPVIANVSRIVTRVVDRITGDRADCPLLVTAACAEALRLFGIDAQMMYGPVAWALVMPDHTVAWAGRWNGKVHFWVATQHGEVVDLNASVAHRTVRGQYSPPLLWSKEVPAFYRYVPEGVAELELTEERDRERFETVMREIREKCGPAHAPLDASEDALEFPNEPILCPGRRILDDSQETFQHFDRAISIRGLPKAPF